MVLVNIVQGGPDFNHSEKIYTARLCMYNVIVSKLYLCN